MILILKTLKVSNKGTIKIENPIATAAGTCTATNGSFATLINLMTSIALISPIISDPESPINIFAG
jgi:hypothetical protein